MEAELKNSSAVVAKEVKHIGILTTVLQVLEDVDKKKEGNQLELNFLWERMSNLDRQYPEEYKSFDLANVALTYLIPLMRARLAQFWRPFDSNSNDEACRSAFLQWRSVLEFRSNCGVGR